MPDEQKTQLRLEIAHVLFMDIVGYSKLLIDEQSEALQELNQLVRKTDAVRAAEAAGQLIFLPTGDGMALVFTGSVEEPVECALQCAGRDDDFRAIGQSPTGIPEEKFVCGIRAKSELATASLRPDWHC